MMTPDSGSLSGLLRRAEFEPASALAGYRKALGQRLLEGVSGAGRALLTIDSGSTKG
jgi:hypothetical protein